MHEDFGVPKNNWEGVYINYHPTSLGATTKEATVDGKTVWLNPLVHGKGILAYSKGRMDRPFGEKEWSAFSDKLTEEYKWLTPTEYEDNITDLRYCLQVCQIFAMSIMVSKSFMSRLLT